MQKWKTLSSKLVFDHPWFKVQQDTVQLPNGKILDDYLMWPEGDVVFIVPVTQNGEFILVEQYKHAAGEILVEFPAGYINKNESPEEAARRELLEETNHDFKSVTKLFESYNNSTKIIGKFHFFLAQDCFIPDVNNHHQDETENIEVVKKSAKEVHEMLFTNEIKTTAGIAAGLEALIKLGFLKANFS